MGKAGFRGQEKRVVFSCFLFELGHFREGNRPRPPRSTGATTNEKRGNVAAPFGGGIAWRPSALSSNCQFCRARSKKNANSVAGLSSHWPLVPRASLSAPVCAAVPHVVFCAWPAAIVRRVSLFKGDNALLPPPPLLLLLLAPPSPRTNRLAKLRSHTDPIGSLRNLGRLCPT